MSLPLGKINAGEQECVPGMHKNRFLRGVDVSQHFSSHSPLVIIQLIIILLLVIQQLVLPALLQDSYREELEWRKQCFKGEHLTKNYNQTCI